MVAVRLAAAAYLREDASREQKQKASGRLLDRKTTVRATGGLLKRAL